MQTSLIINATDSNGTLTKTVTDVNSQTPGSVAHEFGRKINALSTNTFVGVNRVDKELLDGTKTTPTLTLSKNADTLANIFHATDASGSYTVDITYDGDGKISADFMAEPTGDEPRTMPLTWGINADGQLVIVGIHVERGIPNFFGGTITVRASATDTCNPVTATFTITIS